MIYCQCMLNSKDKEDLSVQPDLLVGLLSTIISSPPQGWRRSLRRRIQQIQYQPLLHSGEDNAPSGITGAARRPSCRPKRDMITRSQKTRQPVAHHQQLEPNPPAPPPPTDSPHHRRPCSCPLASCTCQKIQTPSQSSMTVTW